MSTDQTNSYVCSECGIERGDMSKCEACGSVRVILISVAEHIGGPNWREAFEPGAQRPEDLANYEGPKP